MKTITTFFVFAVAFVLIPALALAQNAPNGQVTELVEGFGGIISQLLPIAFTLALLAFFWGIVRLIWSLVNGQETDKTFLIWGIVALFLLASVWGVVGFMQGVFGIEGGGTMKVPDVNTPFNQE